MSIKDNLCIINDKIRAAEAKAGRQENSVQLMAVSKFHTQSEVIEAIKENQFLFGENRVQEAKEKFPQIFESYAQTQLHIIGSLQTNKVKNAVQLASCIQSVDRLELVKEIEKQCAKINKTINIMLEIHTGEESKSGFTSEEEVIKLLDLCEVKTFPHVIPVGFMTMAPFTDDESLIRKSFISLRKFSDKMKSQYKTFSLHQLSMGMSGDFQIAIEEGSTIVRVGTAIFGERDYSKK